MAGTYTATYSSWYGGVPDLYLFTYPDLYGGDLAPPPPPLPSPGLAPIVPVQFPTPQYVYLTTDLVTNQILGELPVYNVTLDNQLNTPGNMTASANLNDPRISNDELLARTIPGKTAFWVYRDNQIVWGGIIWTRQWQSAGKSLTITGQTFESYATRRFPRSWLGIDVLNYASVGQCWLIDELWKGLQSVPNGNIGVRPWNQYSGSDIKRQLTINGYDLSTSFDDLIQSILVFSTGPDYTIIWTEDGNGLPLKQVKVQPKIGNPIGTTDLVVDYPGSIVSYTYNEDAASGNNQWWAVGDGTDAATVVGVATGNNSLASGWPLLEGVHNFSGVTQQDTIDDHAENDLTSLPTPLVTHSSSLFGAIAPEFGSYGLGDYIIVNVTDPRFPQGNSFSVRVIGWTITPPDTGNGVEQIALVFDESTTSGS